MKHAPYGPLVGSLFGTRLLRSSQVCALIFPFQLRTRWGNLNLMGKVPSVAPSSVFLPSDPKVEAARPSPSNT